MSIDSRHIDPGLARGFDAWADEYDRFRLDLAALLGRHGPSDGRPFAVPYRIDLWIARRSGG